MGSSEAAWGCARLGASRKRTLGEGVRIGVRARVRGWARAHILGMVKWSSATTLADTPHAPACLPMYSRVDVLLSEYTAPPCAHSASPARKNAMSTPFDSLCVPNGGFIRTRSKAPWPIGARRASFTASFTVSSASTPGHELSGRLPWASLREGAPWSARAAAAARWAAAAAS
jgi:hypothetical protein